MSIKLTETTFFIPDSFFVWGQWGPWIQCTVDCGLGKRSRFRKQERKNSRDNDVNIKEVVDLKSIANIVSLRSKE